MNMHSLLSRGAVLGRKTKTFTAGLLAAAMLATLAPSVALAQPPPRGGPDHGPGRDIHVTITDPRAGPHFFIGPDHRDFHFVNVITDRRRIETRDSLRDLLLRPLANSVAWGLGNIVTVELANALGLPVNTTVYGVAPGVPVVATLPPGYFVAESIPTNVALVSEGTTNPVVLVNRVPPGAFVAYQTSPTGVVLNECVVVPPVQQVVVPTVVTTTVPVPATPAPGVAATPATEPSASSSNIPMSSKVGKIVYDANQKPIGVIILDSDGKQEFVPLNP
jgi:hypothetical protein